MFGLFCKLSDNVLYFVKVSKSRKQIMVSLIRDGK